MKITSFVYNFSCLVFDIKFEFFKSDSFLFVSDQIEGGRRRGGGKGENREEEREDKEGGKSRRERSRG